MINHKLRGHLISIGALVPDAAREPGLPSPRYVRQEPTLRLDAFGVAAAARHIAEYLEDPAWYYRHPFGWPSKQEFEAQRLARQERR